MIEKKKGGYFGFVSRHNTKFVVNSSGFLCKELKLENWDGDVSGSNAFSDDYNVGKKLIVLTDKQSVNIKLPLDFIKIMLKFVLTNV